MRIKIKIKSITVILFVLALFINLGCNQSGEQQTKVNEQAPKQEQIKSPPQQKSQSDKLDKFGRKPGDPHYGHNHASNKHSNQKNDSLQKPTSGAVDKYGRKPGDPHYGHNHE